MRCSPRADVRGFLVLALVVVPAAQRERLGDVGVDFHDTAAEQGEILSASEFAHLRPLDRDDGLGAPVEFLRVVAPQSQRDLKMSSESGCGSSGY